MELGPIGTNAYLMWEDGGKDAVLIDAPPDSRETVESLLAKESLVLKELWLTHGHWDHMAGAFELLKGDISVIGPRPLMRVGFNRYSSNFKNSVYNVKPGLTGIGSIVFRDEEKILTESKLTPHECYKEIILPHKGELEMWYQNNYSLFLDFQLIFMTAWAIIFPEARLYKKWFKDLPKRNFN